MNQERLLKVLVAPVISEKAALASDASNAVVFKVVKDATRQEIKKAVEKLFDVRVESVQTLNMKGKKKFNRYGQTSKPDWKKAYVRLAAGHDIDFALGE